MGMVSVWPLLGISHISHAGTKPHEMCTDTNKGDWKYSKSKDCADGQMQQLLGVFSWHLRCIQATSDLLSCFWLPFKLLLTLWSAPDLLSPSWLPSQLLLTFWAAPDHLLSCFCPLSWLLLTSFSAAPDHFWTVPHLLLSCSWPLLSCSWPPTQLFQPLSSSYWPPWKVLPTYFQDAPDCLSFQLLPTSFWAAPDLLPSCSQPSSQLLLTSPQLLPTSFKAASDLLLSCSWPPSQGHQADFPILLFVGKSNSEGNKSLHTQCLI